MINYFMLTPEVVAAEEKINPLLPQPYDIVCSLIALGVVFWVFKKYVLPKYLALADERTKKIEGGLAEAKASQLAAEKLLADYKQQLSQAYKEANTIREKAKDEGKQIVAEMRAAAQVQSENVMAAGDKMLQQQRQKIISELRADLGKISVELAEKIVGAALVTDVQKSGMVDQLLAEINSDSYSQK